MKPCHGRAELEARYGRLVLQREPGGGYRIASPIGWEAHWMVLVRDLPGLAGRRLYVNRDIAEPLRAALAAALVACPDYAVRTIGCWNVRYKRTATGEVSMHALGLAVDINADTNPLGPTLVTDMPPAFVDAFRAQGFTWGGDFQGAKDAMHFQWCSNY